MRSTAPRSIAALASVVTALAFAACGGDDDSDGESFTTNRLASVVAVAEAEGPEYADVLEVEMNTDGTYFTIQDAIKTDRPAERLAFAPGSEEPETETVTVVGIPLTFSFFEVEPEAIDKIVKGAEELSGEEDFEITSLLLRKPDGGGPPEWTITYEAGGESDLLYFADADGSDVRAGGE